MLYRKWLFLIVGLLIGTVIQAQETSSSKIIIGYYPSWAVYEGKSLIKDIPGDKLTHISYAFASISPELECQSGDSWADIEMPFEGDADDTPFKGNFHQLQRLKERYPHLKTLIAVGGWAGSQLFSDAALTQERRENFVTSCVKFMQDYGFDGIEVDWQYPNGTGSPSNHTTPQDPGHFVLLIEEFRQQLDAIGQSDGTHYLLTIAAGPGYRQTRGIQWWRVHPYLDWVSIMAYDYSGSWSTITGFNAPLYYSNRSIPEGGSVNSSMVRYINARIPPSKLILGIAAYGWGWRGVPKDHNGLHQVPDDLSQTNVKETESFTYRELVSDYIPLMTRFWSRNARVPWLYDEETGLMISYDDVESVTEKARYVKERGFGGVMLWDLSADTDDYTLLTALGDALMDDPS